VRYWVDRHVSSIFVVRSNEVRNHDGGLFLFTVESRVLDIYVFVLNDGGSTAVQISHTHLPSYRCAYCWYYGFGSICGEMTNASVIKL